MLNYDTKMTTFIFKLWEYGLYQRCVWCQWNLKMIHFLGQVEIHLYPQRWFKIRKCMFGSWLIIMSSDVSVSLNIQPKYVLLTWWTDWAILICKRGKILGCWKRTSFEIVEKIYTHTLHLPLGAEQRNTLFMRIEWNQQQYQLRRCQQVLDV
jgi:hypothetical protein